MSYVIFYPRKEEYVIKKRFYLLLLSLFVFVPNVSAKENYYTNSNGVSLTEEEYDFMTYMFWEGSQELMNQDDYDKFIESNIMNGSIDSKIYSESLTRATSVESTAKTLKITKSCSSNCFMSVTLTWKNNPAVRSYEVMGAYLENTSLVNNPSTTITSSTGTISSSQIKNFSNGFGVSISLPQYGNNLVVNQNFRVSTGGTVYASYQHATKTISLTNSKNYVLSKSGYGGVFQFSGVATSTYDKMNGVDIVV